ncbi:hypothetical protein M688_08415 [Neisseria gonorrhoeae SK22871]|nr:hypothetical protein M688_08415 [Neisseria gonorrhoeae SK22871]
MPKTKLQTIPRLLHSLGLDSIATAADMNRNVLCTSNPIESELHRQAYEYAKKISEHLLPRTRGYLDMWVDGKKVQSSDDFLQEGEPILGKTYLPRKFKTAATAKTTAPATPFKIWAWTTSARKSNAVWVCRSNPYGRSSLPGAATASAG